MSAEPEITSEQLVAAAAALGLRPIPERLLPLVLREVRAHRANMRRFDAAGLDLAAVVTAQPFRA